MKLHSEKCDCTWFALEICLSVTLSENLINLRESLINLSESLINLSENLKKLTARYCLKVHHEGLVDE